MKHMPNHKFYHHLFRNALAGFGIILFSLLIGMVGYRYIENYSWVDAYLNATMILSGMGEIDKLQTTGGKIFAGTYALFSGVVFLVVIAIIFAPLIHRAFQKFHLQDDKK